MRGMRTWIILAALVTSGCVGLPTASRTGVVHEVFIREEGVSAHDLIVQVGDEVRWVNRKATPVWIYFYEDSLDEVSCSRGFSYFWGHEESAKIEPGQSASVCFSKEDAISYTVQDQATIISGSTAGASQPFNIPVSMHAAIVVEEKGKQ
jgi:plastocyanin